MALTFTLFTLFSLCSATQVTTFFPWILLPVKKELTQSEAMWSLGKIVCKLPDRRFNLYHEADIEFQHKFFETIAEDCMKPAVVYG